MVAACPAGSCTFEVAAADTVPADQTPGDCKQIFCDGRGGALSREDRSDTPPDDGNDCTEERCNGDTPEHGPLAAGASCGQGGVCNGAGLCGVCLPGKRLCTANAPQICSAEGQWSKSAACAGSAPVCESGGCVGVAELAVGDGATCARLADGSARCWGAASGSDGGRTQVAVPGAVDLAVGAHHACAVGAGAVWCWGANDDGQLGDGTRDGSAAPVRAAGIKGAARIAAGDEHTCALIGDGSVWCWGKRTAAPKGKPGAAAAPSRGSPGMVRVAGSFAQLALGGGRTCARLQQGGIECWGYETQPRPAAPARRPPAKGGKPVPTIGPKPAAVPGIKGAVEIAASGDRTCALLKDGSVSCWSGAGAPVPVRGVSKAVAIALGRSHACVLLGDGSVSCWGDGAKGQLGDGTTAMRATPAKVPGLGVVTALRARGDDTCAQLRDGGVRCWGDNAAGELGDGTAAARPGPVPVVW